MPTSVVPSMSKEEIVKAIQQCAAKLGRTPNLRDLRLTGGVSEPILYTRFGGLAKALIAAGLEVNGPGFNQPESTLLLDWAGVARKLKKIRVADAFRRFALETKIESQWK